MRCHEPPVHAVASGVLAEVDAQIPEVLQILRLRVDVEKRVELPRPAVPHLEMLEALEFRLCVTWAQDVLREEEYREFLREVVPGLRMGCESE